MMGMPPQEVGKEHRVPGTEEDQPIRDSVLGAEFGRLLQELSWEGPKIRNLRAGGLGYENVLTAEALSGLDFLPRRSFLGSVLRAAHGGDSGRSWALNDVEELEITLLPDEVVLAPSSPNRLIVQPGRAAHDVVGLLRPHRGEAHTSKFLQA